MVWQICHEFGRMGPAAAQSRQLHFMTSVLFGPGSADLRLQKRTVSLPHLAPWRACYSIKIKGSPPVKCALHLSLLIRFTACIADYVSIPPYKVPMCVRPLSIAQRLLPLTQPTLLIRYRQCIQILRRRARIVHPFAQQRAARSTKRYTRATSGFAIGFLLGPI